MPLLNEADTRAKLIDPKIKAAGWGESQIEREHFVVKGKAFTAGRIYLVGEESRRRSPRRADYLFRIHNALAIAVLEAKDESHSVDAGLEQAKGYAMTLGLPFAYCSNGHGFVEFDFFLNRSRELAVFPGPEDLLSRWQAQTGHSRLDATLDRAAEEQERTGGFGGPPPRDPVLQPPCPQSVCGKELRYFQEVAVERVLKRVVAGQRRILLTMATGTGKTFTAFQVVWKLKKSGWLRKPILFLADRIVLRDQAYNNFAPFVDDQSDPRSIIRGGKWNRNRDLYFALYQALDSGDGAEPLFKSIAKDFFGLIIIDECHRSGFGKWNNILQHFSDAAQLGMTATPKRSESIDTYDYFCREEPEVPIDPDDPSKGTWNPPAYQYSLGQGIDDGFLATYKVHKVRTTVDKTGLHVQDAQTQGAEIYVPEGAELRDVYLTPQFEREISLPDRTEVMVNHLAGLLRRFGPREKMMVFCVDIEHARLVSRLLQNAFADLGDPQYAVPIVSEEGDALTWLEHFQDSDKKSPVVATTAELLSTGVDVPACRNIVFMKTISSPLLFKQIIGRGSRVDPSTGKEWFRIIDYVGATRLFDKWDRPPGEQPPEVSGARTAKIEGTVVDADSGALIVGASVSALIGPNEQQGPFRTDGEGCFHFTQLPAGTIRISVSGADYRPRQVSVETEAGSVQTVTIELKTQTGPVEKIRVQNLTVTIADEATFMIESTGQQLTLWQYLDYTRQKVVGHVPDWARLHEVWTDPAKREAFLFDLEAESVHAEVLAEVLNQPRADQFDLLAHIAFDRPIRTRDERAEGFVNYEQHFLNTYDAKAREVVLALLDKYRLSGVTEITSPDVFRLSPFREMGQAPGVIERFGGAESLRQTLTEMQQRLYRKETA
ncbi:MAG: DEAD/DEAH box helicase family protein [Deltaproteobacteria bacterium]|nr:DEAD/DEAH box helicase family protein [Deltaproteobacteria bacterium]